MSHWRLLPCFLSFQILTSFARHFGLLRSLEGLTMASVKEDCTFLACLFILSFKTSWTTSFNRQGNWPSGLMTTDLRESRINSYQNTAWKFNDYWRTSFQIFGLLLLNGSFCPSVSSVQILTCYTEFGLFCGFTLTLWALPNVMQ